MTASLPERLADAEGELPNRLRIIADGDLRTMARDSLIGIHPDQQDLHGWADLMDEAADALTAAESAREAAVAERDGLRERYDWLTGHAIAALRHTSGIADRTDGFWRSYLDARARFVAETSHVVCSEHKRLRADLSAALARAERAEKDLAGWKRVAVVAALPLEAMRMAGSYRALAPSTQACVDEAVVTIRMAVAGHSLPPEGDMDAALAPARAALAHHVTAEET